MVPEENKLAAKLLKSGEQEREERQLMKDLVLQFNSAASEGAEGAEGGMGHSPQGFLGHPDKRSLRFMIHTTYIIHY